MEVILLEKIRKLGAVGDIVKVANGFGRNYLIPTKKALLATEENKNVFQLKKAEIENSNLEKLAKIQELVPGLQNIFVGIVRQAGEDGRLFGSVNSRDIADSISKEAGMSVQKSSILLSNPIKYIGSSKIEVALHPEVSILVTVNVSRTEAEAEEARKVFLDSIIVKS